MVAIQIVSDLHLESPKAYDIFDTPPKAPYLALLGDIGYAAAAGHCEEYLGFLRRQLSAFRVVFLVLGNHEPWHGTWDGVKEIMRRFEEDIRRERGTGKGGLGEFVFLDRKRYDIPSSPLGGGDGDGEGEGIAILGCTLFSRVPAEATEAVSFGVNDFYHIENWTVEKHNEAFQGDLAWLNEQVASLDSLEKRRKAVIFTHYSPTLDTCAVDSNHSSSPIQAGFATDLSDEPWPLPRQAKEAYGFENGPTTSS